MSRDVDWPQPLKYLDFFDRGLEVRPQTGGSAGKQLLVITSHKPVKCLVFEERANVQISDSAIDIVPGDEQVVEIKGLSDSDPPLGYRYLGQ